MTRKRHPKDRPEHDSNTQPSKRENTSAEIGENGWPRERKRSGKHPIGSKGDRMTRIESLLKAKKWKQAQALLYRELADAPTDHWIWFSLSLTHYEMKEYDLAMKCGQRAVELQSNCPLALWHYAGSLYMNGQASQALAIWTIMLGLDLDDVAHGECGEGMDSALRLINDAHYRMGRCYQHLGKTAQASESYEKYLHNRSHGVHSAYDDAPIKEFLAGVSLAN
jgi:tetratricopeptide (TPR) repeat protein